ncbi:hypothetical protein TYRP_008696 [Tyrophagus putrescentiae]|nr:hypothetical protein TYRP_008696 [Tyrophagus putrescentiae]
MAISDEAVREGSSARSVRWPAYRQAAEPLAREQSDDVNKAYKPAAPRRSETVAQRTGCPVRAHHRRQFAVPKPFRLWTPEPCAHSP